ncbi:hypothetical protein AB1Y20_004986 [Prymnesium parvum]|uniref:BspA family leucine-rich repeat surface protein n=1 Tax=Prymnesium parvum TaxID=97485 RepID=A0AB34J2V8_PRYPA
MLASLPVEVLCTIAREVLLSPRCDAPRHVLQALAPIVPADVLLLAVLDHRGIPLPCLEYVLRRRGRPADRHVSVETILDSLEVVRHTSRQGAEWLASIQYEPPPIPDGRTLRALVRAYIRGDHGIKEQYGPLKYWNTSQITDMSSLFARRHLFDESLAYWDVSNVTNMRGMFDGAESFNQPLAWDVSSVTNMRGMFDGAASFNQSLAWDVSSVTDMSGMFGGAASFDQPLAWDVSSVADMHLPTVHGKHWARQECDAVGARARANRDLCARERYLPDIVARIAEEMHGVVLQAMPLDANVRPPWELAQARELVKKYLPAQWATPTLAGGAPS